MTQSNSIAMIRLDLAVVCPGVAWPWRMAPHTSCWLSVSPPSHPLPPPVSLPARPPLTYFPPGSELSESNNTFQHIRDLSCKNEGLLGKILTPCYVITGSLTDSSISRPATSYNFIFGLQRSDGYHGLSVLQTGLQRSADYHGLSGLQRSAGYHGLSTLQTKHTLDSSLAFCLQGDVYAVL